VASDDGPAEVDVDDEPVAPPDDGRVRQALGEADHAVPDLQGVVEHAACLLPADSMMVAAGTP
jgi:hypothetical protein